MAKNEIRVGINSIRALVYSENHLGGVVRMCTARAPNAGVDEVPLATTAGGCLALAEGLTEMAAAITKAKKGERDGKK